MAQSSSQNNQDNQQYQNLTQIQDNVVLELPEEYRELAKELAWTSDLILRGLGETYIFTLPSFARDSIGNANFHHNNVFRIRKAAGTGSHILSGINLVQLRDCSNNNTIKNNNKVIIDEIEYIISLSGILLSRKSLERFFGQIQALVKNNGSKILLKQGIKEQGAVNGIEKPQLTDEEKAELIVRTLASNDVAYIKNKKNRTTKFAPYNKETPQNNLDLLSNQIFYCCDEGGLNIGTRLNRKGQIMTHEEVELKRKADADVQAKHLKKKKATKQKAETFEATTNNQVFETANPNNNQLNNGPNKRHKNSNDKEIVILNILNNPNPDYQTQQPGQELYQNPNSQIVISNLFDSIYTNQNNQTSQDQASLGQQTQMLHPSLINQYKQEALQNQWHGQDGSIDFLYQQQSQPKVALNDYSQGLQHSYQTEQFSNPPLQHLASCPYSDPYQNPFNLNAYQQGYQQSGQELYQSSANPVYVNQNQYQGILGGNNSSNQQPNTSSLINQYKQEALQVTLQNQEQSQYYPTDFMYQQQNQQNQPKVALNDYSQGLQHSYQTEQFSNPPLQHLASCPYSDPYQNPFNLNAYQQGYQPRQDYQQNYSNNSQQNADYATQNLGNNNPSLSFGFANLNSNTVADNTNTSLSQGNNSFVEPNFATRNKTNLGGNNLW